MDFNHGRLCSSNVRVRHTGSIQHSLGQADSGAGGVGERWRLLKMRRRPTEDAEDTEWNLESGEMNFVKFRGI